jgi:type II secretory pathway pseudopilin PulG
MRSTRRTVKTYCRKGTGLTIIEMLVATMVIGVTMAVLGELVVLNTKASTKLTTLNDASLTAGVAMQRVINDIRASSTFGNIPLTTSSILYGASGPYFSSLPSQTGWTNPTISSTCLILQQPVLYRNPTNALDDWNGIPLSIPAGTFSLNPSNPVANVNTVIYNLIPDPDPENSGQYLLQVARLPGYQLSNLPDSKNTETLLSINPPVTILKGIIGPVPEGSSTPSIFQNSLLTALYPVNTIGVQFEVIRLNGAQTISDQSAQVTYYQGVGYLRNAGSNFLSL